jgi:hypothetical protein
VPFTTTWYWAIIDSLCKVPRIQDPADVSVHVLDLGNSIDNINFAHCDSHVGYADSVINQTLSHKFDIVKVKQCVHVLDNISQFDGICNCNFISEGHSSSGNYFLDSKNDFVDRGLFSIFL